MHRAVLLSFTLLVACKGKSDSKDPPPAPPSSPAAPAPSAPAPAPTPAPPAPEAAKPAPPAAEGGTVSFDLNGAAAATEPRAGDSDKQSGQVAAANDTISLFFHGGPADWPKRGWINVHMKPFTYAPGKLTGAKAIFVWYRGKANGGDANYDGPMDVEITSFTEIEKSAIGRRWKASGTFSGELPLMKGFKADIPTMKVTNGKFEDLLIQELGKKK